MNDPKADIRRLKDQIERGGQMFEIERVVALVKEGRRQSCSLVLGHELNSIMVPRP